MKLSTKSFVFTLLALLAASYWVEPASAQLKIKITPKVKTRNVTKNSCKARITLTVRATDQKTKKTVFSKTLTSAEVTLLKNVEITIPPPPPPPGLKITIRGRYTGTEVRGLVRVELQVLGITVKSSKSFSEKVEVTTN